MIFQKIGQVSRSLEVGDIVANRVGKTFVFTGLDMRGNLSLTSTCDNRYFSSGKPEDYNCYIGSRPNNNEQSRTSRECSAKEAV